MKATIFILAITVIMVLSGCDTVKYAECIARDRTSNPCQ